MAKDLVLALGVQGEIHEKREQIGLSLTKLAELSGVSVHTLNSISCGRMKTIQRSLAERIMQGIYAVERGAKPNKMPTPGGRCRNGHPWSRHAEVNIYDGYRRCGMCRVQAQRRRGGGRMAALQGKIDRDVKWRERRREQR